MIDLVYPPYLLQITTSNTHSVKQSGYSKIKDIFPSVKNWVLVFIVPHKREETFKLSLDSMKMLGVYQDTN